MQENLHQESPCLVFSRRFIGDVGRKGGGGVKQFTRGEVTPCVHWLASNTIKQQKDYEKTYWKVLGQMSWFLLTWSSLTPCRYLKKRWIRKPYGNISNEIKATTELRRWKCSPRNEHGITGHLMLLDDKFSTWIPRSTTAWLLRSVAKCSRQHL